MVRGFLDDQTTATLDTPAVVVDLDRVDARIGGMAELMLERGVALRPHAKTHKSLAFARRQLAAGAVGLTVATIGEAEVFADDGVEDLFIGYPVIAHGPKAERLRRLADRCRLSVGVDSVTGIDSVASAFAGRQATASAPVVLIEVDVGGERTGVRPESVLALAQAAEARGLTVGGVFTHGGHGYAGRAERVAAAEDEVDGLTTAAERLRVNGIDARVVSAGSTPTAGLSARGAITEERPGTYIFGDRQQAFLADQALDDTALLVAATVVSHGSGGGFVVDAGAKILAKDVAPYLPGHGSVVGYLAAVIERVNDHHGVVELPAGASRPAIGDVVWIAPNHVCPVVNLVHEYVVAQGGRIVGRWPVDARGRNA
jgi:D-serine deaminase-like pyridoxal phosphate-dependent protein